MKIPLKQIAFYLLTALVVTPVVADSQPAMLDALDPAHVSTLDSSDETRGKYFLIDIDNPDLAADDAEAWCEGMRFLCLGNYAGVVTGGYAYIGVEYRWFNFQNGRFVGMVNRWKKY